MKIKLNEQDVRNLIETVLNEYKDIKDSIINSPKGREAMYILSTGNEKKYMKFIEDNFDDDSDIAYKLIKNVYKYEKDKWTKIENAKIDREQNASPMFVNNDKLRQRQYTPRFERDPKPEQEPENEPENQIIEIPSLIGQKFKALGRPSGVKDGVRVYVYKDTFEVLSAKKIDDVYNISFKTVRGGIINCVKNENSVSNVIWNIYKPNKQINTIIISPNLWDEIKQLK